MENIKNKKGIYYFSELIKNNKDVVYINNLKNPVKIDGEETIIYCYAKGKIYECIIDTIYLNKICLNCTWTACVRKDNEKVRVRGKNGFIYNYILDRLNSKDNYVVDHINGNTLDNRINNLRIVTQGKNMLNKRKYKNGNLKHITKYKDRYVLAIYRIFYNVDIAIEARGEFIKIMNKYSEKDIQHRSYRKCN